MRRIVLALAGMALVGAVAAGCSKGEAPMTQTEASQFKGGGPSQPRSAAKQQEIADFQKEFNAKHPPAGPPNGGAPVSAGAPH